MKDPTMSSNNYAHSHPVGEECHCFDDLGVTTVSSTGSKKCPFCQHNPCIEAFVGCTSPETPAPNCYPDGRGIGWEQKYNASTECKHTGTASFKHGVGWLCDNCGGVSGNHGGTPGGSGLSEPPAEGWEEELEKLAWRYVGGSGCANCWGDLHQGCDSSCRGMDEAEKERNDFKENIRTLVATAEKKARETTVDYIKREAGIMTGMSPVNDYVISYRILKEARELGGDKN